MNPKEPPKPILKTKPKRFRDRVRTEDLHGQAIPTASRARSKPPETERPGRQGDPLLSRPATTSTIVRFVGGGPTGNRSRIARSCTGT